MKNRDPKAWLALLIAVSGFMPTNTLASSNDLIKACRIYVQPKVTTEEAWVGSSCFSYLSGFYDGWTTNQAVTGIRSFICYPTKVSYQQLAEVVVKWADDHPELRHLDDWETTYRAYNAAFPCP